MSDVLAVAFTPAPADQSPNLRRTTDAAAAGSYYRAITVTLGSARRWNPDLELVLVTDAALPGPVAGELRGLAVSVLPVPFEHRPPAGFAPTFAASLYSIDAIAALAQRRSPGDRILLLDPDVLCVGPLDPVFGAFNGRRILVYPTGFPPVESSQGLSAIDAMPLHLELDPTLTGPPVHYGGELYGFTGTGAGPLLRRAQLAWELALRRFAAGQPHFVTEEHLLNYALRGAELVDATRYIRRIWTAPIYRTVNGDEDALLLWHLPSEKDRAFVAYHRAALDRTSWFWQGERRDFVHRAGSLVGIPRRRPHRWCYDVAGATVRGAQRRVRSLAARSR